MKRSFKVGLTVAGIATALVLTGTTGAVAAKMITGAQIKDGTIQRVDLSDGINNKLDKTGEQGEQGEPGEQGPAGETGPAGPQGEPGAASTVPGPAGPAGATGATGATGANGLTGAVYRIAHYDNGGGGIASVACADTEAASQNYTAISGGARVDVAGAGTATEPITSSFPGRMDWNTNTPKADRLDGWIVKFGNGAGPGSAPGDVLEIWALCVPTISIDTEVTHY